MGAHCPGRFEARCATTRGISCVSSRTSLDSALRVDSAAKPATPKLWERETEKVQMLIALLIGINIAYILWHRLGAVKLLKLQHERIAEWQQLSEDFKARMLEWKAQA